MVQRIPWLPATPTPNSNTNSHHFRKFLSDKSREVRPSGAQNKEQSFEGREALQVEGNLRRRCGARMWGELGNLRRTDYRFSRAQRWGMAW